MLNTTGCGWKAKATDGVRSISFELVTSLELVNGLKLSVLGARANSVGSVEVAASDTDDFTYIGPIWPSAEPKSISIGPS